MSVTPIDTLSLYIISDSPLRVRVEGNGTSAFGLIGLPSDL